MSRAIHLTRLLPVVLAVALTAGSWAATVTLLEGEIRVARVPEGSQLRDPHASFWANVPETRVAMLPQVVAMPTEPDPSVDILQVRAAHDGHFLAVRLEWADAARDEVTLVDHYGDQVAVQFPADPDAEVLPNPMMGHRGAPVRILQWRAVLQHEVRHGSPTIRDLYPNAEVDLYPDRLLAGEVADAYTGARGLGNPISRPRLLSPVVTHVAEGWGTLTAAPDQQADGSGDWDNGRWRVAVTYPLAPTGVQEGLRPGASTSVAFAVWDGSNQEVGGRKAWTGWTSFHIEE